MADQFLMPRQIFYGKGALERAGSAIAACGHRALLVTDPTMEKLGNLDLVKGALEAEGVSFAVFDGVTGEPTDVMVEAGLAAWEKEGCDFLVAVGGGSPIDTMKAIAASAAGGRSIDDFYGEVIDLSLPPMVAIPTTSGTGSEATQFTIITDTKKNIKMLLRGACLMPDLAVDDPAFTKTAPPSVTAATGLDALCHAAEAYTSRKAQPLTDVLAVSAVKRIFQNLPICFQDGSNVAARAQMSLAALEAGAAFNNSSVTVIHGMSRPIGALFHVPHGVSNAMLLPTCFSAVYPAAAARFADLARAVGAAKEGEGDLPAAGKFVDACAGLCAFCRIPTPEEYGIDRGAFFAAIPKMTRDALASGSPANTVMELDEAAISGMYRALWN